MGKLDDIRSMSRRPMFAPQEQASPNERHLTPDEQQVFTKALRQSVKVVAKAKSRNQRWREKHPDKYRDGQRELMRKRRTANPA